MTVGPGVLTREEKREESDARVIERSRDEPELFAVLFDRHADTVHRYAARRLGPEAAEDLMAETFTTAFQRRHTYDLERADARPWLFGIATNLASRRRRAEARRLALSRVPGVKVTPGLTDAEGRTGIGISLSGPGTIGSTFIFDPESYEFLGFRDSRTSGDGTDMKSYSQLTYLDGWAVTDRARQRP